jgi:dTDP-4-amino-4,6-dideoxygalactose transaminase
VTDRQADRIIRLPLWVGLSIADQAVVISALRAALSVSSAQ